MPVRMSGLVSGLDTESIVSELMKAQRTKQTKVENKQQKLEWKKEIWSSLNTKLYGFYNTSLSRMKLQSGYNSKMASSSDTTKVKATATSQAANGSYSIKVKSLASAQYVTSGKVTSVDGTDVKSDTKLMDLGSNRDNNEIYLQDTQINITSGDKSVSLTVDEETTVEDFVNKCKEAGLNASFDTKQQRFFISSKKSGDGNGFTITTNELDDNQHEAISALKDVVSYDNLSSSQKNTLSSVMSNLQFGDDEPETKIQDAVDKLAPIAEKAAKDKLKKYYSDSIKESYKSQYLNADDTLKAEGRQALIDSGVSESYFDNHTDTEIIAKVNELINKKTQDDLNSATYQNLINSALENGLTDGSEVIVSSAEQRRSDIENAARSYETAMSSVVSSGNPLEVLGFSAITGDTVSESDTNTGMVVIAASDSVVEYNGAELTSKTTDITIGDITANLLAVTGNESVTISVTNDTDGIYDSIKDFITEYNSILSEMNTKYSAASSKGYDVLTDDQKKAMSDNEIELWNKKIKDSLLRRDSTLDGIRSTFRTAIMGTVKASNGKSYSLANLGITTSTDYKEYGLLHIKGDEDDSIYADSENTLKKMIDEDPETLKEVMTGLLTNLYDALGKKMRSTTLSSALTFYNDKEMDKQIEAYKKDVKSWQSKLASMENRYYAQFTAMEKAMATMQSQQNSLSSMM